MEFDQKLLEPLNKLKEHLQTSDTPSMSNLEFYITKNTDIEEKSELDKVIEDLIQEEVVILSKHSAESKKTIKDVNIGKFRELAGLRQSKPFMEKEFPLGDWDGASKTRKAKEYANWLIEELNIRPVWINGATIFYRYNPEKGTWNEIDFEIIKKKAHKDLKQDYTSHFHREFRNSFRDHHNFIEFSEMGLDENEILLKNRKVLDLRTLELRDIKKDDHALNCVNAVYKTEVESDGLKEFIESTIDEEEMVQTFQEFLGYTLTWPSDKYEKMLLILGSTDTGKSTLLTLCKKFFSGSNITKISFPQIGMDRAFHVENLKDAVLNLDSDMDDQKIRRSSRVKKVISKEEIYVEPKGEKGFEMKPRANFIVTSNNAPDSQGVNDAYYNRFLTLTATTRIPDEEKDRELADKLTTEQNLNWLLNWAIEGLKRLRERNSFTLKRTEYETKEIWDRFGSSIQKFINKEIIRDSKDGYNIKTTDLFEIYEKWCENQLEEEVSRQEFISKAEKHPDLTKRNTFDKHGKRGQCFVKIRLKNYQL